MLQPLLPRFQENCHCPAMRRRQHWVPETPEILCLEVYMYAYCWAQIRDGHTRCQWLRLKMTVPLQTSTPSCQVCKKLETPSLPHCPNQEPPLKQQLITQFWTQFLAGAHLKHGAKRVPPAWTKKHTSKHAKSKVRSKLF